MASLLNVLCSYCITVGFNTGTRDHFLIRTEDLEHCSSIFVLLGAFKVINSIGISKNYAAPNKGLEPLTLRLKV